MAKRPPIPTELERQVLLEAGHRCAIHACRQHPVEIAHIVPWAQVREHKLPNLIALCPMCHTRYDRHEIDRKSMLTYKRKSWVQSLHFRDLEKRLLAQMAQQGASHVWVFGQLSLLLSVLLADGLIADTGETRPLDLPETLREKRYKLTESGKQLLSVLTSFESSPW